MSVNTVLSKPELALASLDRARTSADLSHSERFSKTISFAVNWAKAVNGDKEVLSVLCQFSDLLRAKHIKIVRHEVRCSTWRTVCSATASLRETKSHAAEVLGDHVELAAIGTVWTGSEVRAESEPFAAERMHERLQADDLAEIAVVVMEKAGPFVYVMEVQFGENPDAESAGILHSLALEISSIWHSRKLGTVDRLLGMRAQRNDEAYGRTSQRDILAAENPCELTRSEFRVCVLLSYGLSVKQIAKQVEVKPCTVRSHLTSIYEKTGTAGQLDLLHSILSGKSDNVSTGLVAAVS